MSITAREQLAAARGTPIKRVKGSGTYREVYSSTFWALMEQVLEEHGRLEKQVDGLYEMVKVVNNQSQNVLSEARRLIKELLKATEAVKSLSNEMNKKSLSYQKSKSSSKQAVVDEDEDSNDRE